MKPKPMLMYTALLVLALTLAACGSDQPVDDGWTTYQSPQGLSFEIPQDWAVEEGDGVVTLASSPEALDSGDLNGAAGASITHATIDDFEGSNDTAIILDLFIDFFDSGTAELEQISPPGPTTIQGQTGSTVSYRGIVSEQDGLYTATVIANDTRLALILSIDGSTDERYAADLERVVNSLQMIERVTE